MDLNAWLSDTRLVVCVGSGGVGKTTTAATIALWGAIHGRKALVLTIDPAKRLANSLGLKQIGNEELRIDLSSIPEAKGELWAMMLDSRGTFDALIARVSPDEATRQRILANHVYRHMADTFAGSQDYMATERLYDVALAGRYDLLVLDTPPVKNALDFLESPGRLVNFLDERVLKWFLQPYQGQRSISQRLMMGTSTVVYYLLGQVFGNDFLDDLAQFFQDFQGLYEGFVARHEAVLALFRDRSTQFVTISAPTESAVDVAEFFQQELAVRELPRGGVIVNQVHRCEGTSHDASEVLGGAAREIADVPEPVVNAVLARLGMAHKRLRDLAVAEGLLTEKLRRAARRGGFYAEVPRLDGEVHDLRSLYEVGRALFHQDAKTL